MGRRCCCGGNCACSNIDGEIGCDIEVTLADIDPTAPVDCGDCGDLNDVFIASSVNGNSPFLPCEWKYDIVAELGGRVCGANQIMVDVYMSGFDYVARCRVMDNATEYLTFEKNLGTTKPAAADLANLSLPLTWASPVWSPTAGDCDGSNATCAIDPV